MDVKWTDEQRHIIEADGNIIVSAAAGSGKTAVLTERIVKKIEAGVKMSEMLVVTFTNAAAAEMKQRIEKALLERSDAESDTAKKREFYEQANATAYANISTLHSFCSQVLRRYFYEVDISPTFRIDVDDGAEPAGLLDEAVDEAFDALYECDGLGKDLILLFLGEENLEGAVRDVLRAVRSRSDGREWLHNAVEAYNMSAEELEKSAAVKELLGYVNEYVKTAYEMSEKSQAFADLSGEQHSIISQRMETFRHVIKDCRTYDEYREALNVKPKGFNGTKCTDEFKKFTGKINEQYKEASEIICDINAEAELLRRAYPYMKELEKLVNDIEERYDQKKKKRGIVDSSDLELLALKVLKKSEIAETYKKKFKYVFVDEYQDINPIQDEIINCVISENNAFFVGDIKQSIYRFRNAKPELFKLKMQQYDTKKNSNALNLSANFRSSDAVINFANSIFEALMTEDTGGIVYDEKNKLHKMGRAGEGSVRLRFIDTDNAAGGNNDEDLEQLRRENAQARLIADEIKRMMTQKLHDSKTNKTRNYKYSDFAILMRGVKTHGDVFVRELIMQGIPVHMESSTGYFNALEVQIFMSLLSVIDNRRQDVPLLSVLRSVIGGFDINEITDMRIVSSEAVDGMSFDMLDTLSYCADMGNKKARDFLHKLNVWYDLSQYMSVSELVEKLMTDTGYYSFVSALPDGRRRAANLERFKSLAAAYDSTISEGLYGFLQYLENAKAHMKIGSSQEASQDAVSIITMHSGKGLEFNVVILPEMQRSIMSRSIKRECLNIGEDSIIGARLVFGNQDTENIYYTLLKHRQIRAQYADEIRLLYVAMTRARENLILVAAVKDAKKQFLKNTDADIKMSGYHVNHDSKTYADWIAFALMVNKKYRKLLDEFMDRGAAEEQALYIDTTPIGAFSLPEQDIDVSRFEEELNKLREADTSEIEAERAWTYPHKDDMSIVAKGSVTGFAHSEVTVRYPQIKDESSIPVGGISAARRGTVTHKVLESMPLTEHTEESVRSFVESMEKRGEITPKEAQSVNIKKLAEFFSRPLYKRILSSERVLKEQEFSCLVEAWRINDDIKSDELVLLQGVIDCCFMENGEWVVVDFKTDRINSYEPEAVKAQAYTHKKQLELYAYVLQKITGIKTAQCYISFINAYDVEVE